MSFGDGYVEKRIRKNTFFKQINRQFVEHQVIIKNGSGMLDTTLTDSPRRFKGQASYELAQDRKEDQRSAEEQTKEALQMKLAQQQQPCVDSEADI